MELEKSTSYKWKMEDISFTVDIDDSYANQSNFAPKDDHVSSIKYQHSHLRYELFFVGEEPLTMFVENDMTEYKNCILCIPAGFHHLAFRQSDYRFLFHIEEPKTCRNNFSKFICNLLSEKQPFQLKTDAIIHAYARELEGLIEAKNSMQDEMVLCMLKLMFYKMYEINTQRQNDCFLSKSESYIVKIEEMVNCFTKDVSLQAVANVLHLSPKQASRIIHKNYQKSLPALVLERKLSAACRLLRHTNSTVAEIMEYTNFSSESYFYAQFKKAYGCTPCEYREQKRP